MNDTDTLTGYPPGLPLLDEEVHEAVNMDVDAATSSLVAESQPDNYNLAPTRSGRKRRPPKRFRDEPPPPVPSVPAPAITLPGTPSITICPLPPSVHPLNHPVRQVTSTFQTEANSFGIYRLYTGGRPSIYPRTQAAAQMYNSPNFEATHSEERRPWWVVFGTSLKAVIDNMYAPFENATKFLLMLWQSTGADSKSNSEMDRLVDILSDPRFDTKDLQGFSAEREGKRVDAFAETPLDTNALFSPNDGWVEATAELRLPCEGRKLKEELAPCFDIGGVFFRRPLEVLKAALRDPTEQYMHWFPFQEYWRPNKDAAAERVYSELYNSDAFIDEHRRLNERIAGMVGQLPRMEAVIVGIMLWSDSTHLASFGTASLWPIYIDVFGVSASSDIITHCKRELIHLIWLLILDKEFMHAYVHGFDYLFHDGIRRLVFPRLFTYAADYPEKVLLACIKYLAKCPCPRCLIIKDDISDIGKRRDMINRMKCARIDDPTTQVLIAGARNAIFECGASFSCQYIEAATGDRSLTPVRSAFSTRFYEQGVNHYEMFVPDLLHEFELGVWKATFVHLMRILYANGNDTIQKLNKRYRQVPTYGRGTIRRFGSNASGMKKLAARDYEDLLQCSIPVFDGLLPPPHNRIVLNLLFELATWHALAKLRLHTETTINALEASTKRLGKSLREFKSVTCETYVTKELPSEEAARGRRESALRAKQPASNGPTTNTTARRKREKKFNLSTYKLHALGDYPHTIRMFGTTDGYTSQVGETQHKKVKVYYKRASKSQSTRSITKRERRERILRNIAECSRAAEANMNAANHPVNTQQNKKRKGPILLLEDEEKLPYTDPNDHYHIGKSTKYKLNIYQWPDEELLEQDFVYKDWYIKLLDHLLARLKGYDLFDGDEHVFSDKERSCIVLDNEAIYQHKVLRVNYTTYDLRRDQDSVNPRTHPDIMMVAHEDEPGPDPHPYWYARVVGIFHAEVLWRGESSPPKRMEFLWVRWYGRDLDHHAGWKRRRLHRIGFISSSDPAAYGFLDPANVIRAVHLIPAFELGRTTAYLTGPIVRPAKLEDSEWRQYYINQYRGGGVGHKSTREATDQFLQDRHPSEAPVAFENGDDDDMEGEGGERMPQIAMGEDEDSEDENENENGNNKEQEQEDEEALGPEDGEDHDDEDEEVGYGAL
ncbi:hypothetical protein F5887DRAFT_1086897 [Amanita rubescens]|nr:hypothetical protein F5887DRAFT_1086897 [Amanita rubescens]